jgi:hypothetical protein
MSATYTMTPYATKDPLRCERHPMLWKFQSDVCFARCMLKNRGRFEIHDVPKWRRCSYIGCIRCGTYCSGTFYHMRFCDVIMFIAVGPYAAASFFWFSIHTIPYPTKILFICFENICMVLYHISPPPPPSPLHLPPLEQTFLESQSS